MASSFASGLWISSVCLLFPSYRMFSQAQTQSQWECAALMSGFTASERPLHGSARLKVMHANPDLDTGVTAVLRTDSFILHPWRVVSGHFLPTASLKCSQGEEWLYQYLLSPTSPHRQHTAHCETKRAVTYTACEKCAHAKSTHHRHTLT